MITQAELKEHLNYNQETGVFTWIKGFGAKSRARFGKTAGSFDKDGYIVIGFKNKNHKAHRLAWLYVHGEAIDRKTEIDHIDGDKTNNRISNLRLATRSQNMMNTRIPKTNSSGVKGVSFDKSKNRYVANIKINQKQIKLGAFKNIDDAKAAYEAASRKYHGEYSLVVTQDKAA